MSEVIRNALNKAHAQAAPQVERQQPVSRDHSDHLALMNDLHWRISEMQKHLEIYRGRIFNGGTEEELELSRFWISATRDALKDTWGR